MEDTVIPFSKTLFRVTWKVEIKRFYEGTKQRTLGTKKERKMCITVISKE